MTFVSQKARPLGLAKRKVTFVTESPHFCSELFSAGLLHVRRSLLTPLRLSPCTPYLAFFCTRNYGIASFSNECNLVVSTSGNYSLVKLSSQPGLLRDKRSRKKVHMDKEKSLLVSVADCASMLAISEKTIRNWMYLNKFPLRTFLFGGRRLFRREDVENFAKDFGRCQSPSPDAPAQPKKRGRGRPRNTGVAKIR